MPYNVVDVSLYIINRANDNSYVINNNKVQKLLYLVQAMFLLEKCEVCFNSKMVAWCTGPCVPESYHEFLHYGIKHIDKIEKYKKLVWVDDNPKERIQLREFIVSDIELIGRDKDIINYVIDYFGCATNKDLLEFFEDQTPFADTPINEEITPEKLINFFKSNTSIIKQTFFPQRSHDKNDLRELGTPTRRM